MKNIMQICWVSNLQTFTAKIYCTIFLICAAQLALAQLTDDFSDNDFTKAPPWTGNDSQFIVSGNQLKLEAPNEDGVSFLSTPSSVEKDASWEFKLKMEFNPSASNYSKVYLVADQADLSGSLNGYFVMIGDSKDEVSLYRQEGISISKIVDGRDGILNLSIIEIKIRVFRDETGSWQLFTDLGLTGSYFLEGSFADNNSTVSRYFGILCSYTATRSDKFFFDDFNIQGDKITDHIAPSLVSLEARSSNELILTFSESLDAMVATKPENYSVSPAVGNPTETKLNPDQKTVLLKFNSHFLENSTSVLTISGITDLSGNLMEPLASEFLFVAPVKTNPKDVIITEIFADPSPLVGLPDSEFVEIFNRSTRTLDLSGWKFTDQSSLATLPDFMLLPQEHVVLTSENSALPDSTRVLRLPGFPSLNNSADVLILKDANNNTIDSVNYSDSWYRNEDKREGGWTLEIIDPNNICSAGENWVASENDLGGTPGTQNSVFANKPDLTGPKLVFAIPTSPFTLQLHFDEKLEKSLRAGLTFKIDPSLDVNAAAFSDPSLTRLQLSLTKEIQAGVSYLLTVENLYDCAGNLIQAGTTIEFGLPEEVDSLDVLINEILFNPKPTGVDFVEIINTSGKFINLKNWALASVEDGSLKNKITISSEDFLLKPGGILAFTENSNILRGEYLTMKEQHLLQVSDLPVFNDDFGSVALVDANGRVIDYFAYTKDMHSVFIKDEEGVSLERISSAIALGDQNWKSATSSIGFATPGYVNSNAFQESSFTSEILKVEPEIFNPLGGQNNFALVHYNFEQGGQVANVKVFDSQGHLIKELANNDVVGVKGFYRWDGDRDDGTKAGIGYYMIWFETFDDRGSIQNFQARVAIAASF
jgi:hypothetical protein